MIVKRRSLLEEVRDVVQLQSGPLAPSHIGIRCMRCAGDTRMLWLLLLLVLLLRLVLLLVLLLIVLLLVLPVLI